MNLNDFIVDDKEPVCTEVNAVGERCHAMIIRLLEFLKVEVEHEGAGTPINANDFLNKVIGLAHEYDLPGIREKAFECQQAGQRG